jgi:hypothetical protein
MIQKKHAIGHNASRFKDECRIRAVAKDRCQGLTTEFGAQSGGIPDVSEHMQRWCTIHAKHN